MPTNEYRFRSWPNSQQCEKRAKTRGRQTGQNRDRMNEAFVENAENKVNHEHGNNQQDAKTAKRALESRRGSLIAEAHRVRQADLARCFVHQSCRLAQRNSRLHIELEIYRWKLADMVHAQGRDSLLQARHRR